MAIYARAPLLKCGLSLVLHRLRPGRPHPFECDTRESSGVLIILTKWFPLSVPSCRPMDLVSFAPPTSRPLQQSHSLIGTQAETRTFGSPFLTGIGL